MAPTLLSYPPQSPALTYAQDVPLPPHSPPSDADDLFELMFPDEPVNDNSDHSDDPDGIVIFVSAQSNRTSSPTSGGATEHTEQTHNAGSSGTSDFDAGSQKERESAVVKNYKARAKEQAK